MRESVGTADIPVIDISALTRGERDERAVEQLGAAASDEGIAFLVGHHVEDVIARAKGRAAAFFDLPLDDRMLVVSRDGLHGYRPLPATGEPGDRKETYFCERGLGEFARPGSPVHGDNVWPAVDDFRDVMQAALAALTSLGQVLAGAFDLHLAAHGALAAAFGARAAGGLRVLRYPIAQSADDWLGSSLHIDLPALALLSSSDFRALEWRDRRGEWHALPPRSDALLLQIGAVLGRMTNDVYRPNPHRVVLSTERRRDSLAFFFQPSLDADVRCVDSTVTAERPARYPGGTYEHYLEEWLRAMQSNSEAGALVDD